MAQPIPVSRESRRWAMAAHLSAFAGAWVALAFLGPLVVWLLRRESDAFVDRHAREALNFNLTMLIALAAGILLTVVTLGIGIVVTAPLGGILALFWLIATIVAAVRASDGDEFRYPLSIRLL